LSANSCNPALYKHQTTTLLSAVQVGLPSEVLATGQLNWPAGSDAPQTISLNLPQVFAPTEFYPR